MKHKRFRKFLKNNQGTLWLIGVFLVLDLVAFVWYVNVMTLQYREFITEEPQQTNIAIVFGGGMEDENTMSVMQTDRVLKGIDLYEAGIVDQILLSGDDGRRNFDEVRPMREFAIERGVPSSDLILDFEGTYTFYTCDNAAHVFGINKAIVISNEFHLPRILYMCRSLGMDAIGVSADRRDYNNSWMPGGREVLARVKGWSHVNFR